MNNDELKFKLFQIEIRLATLESHMKKQLESDEIDKLDEIVDSVLEDFNDNINL